MIRLKGNGGGPKTLESITLSRYIPNTIKVFGVFGKIMDLIISNTSGEICNVDIKLNYLSLTQVNSIGHII